MISITMFLKKVLKEVYKRYDNDCLTLGSFDVGQPAQGVQETHTRSLPVSNWRVYSFDGVPNFTRI